MKHSELMRDAVNQLGGTVSANEAALLFTACANVPDTVSVVVGGVQYSEPEVRLLGWLEDVAPAWFRTRPELVQAYAWACANPHADPPSNRREAYKLVGEFLNDNRNTTSQLVVIVTSATGIPIAYPEDETLIRECAEPWLSEAGHKLLSEIRREAQIVTPQAMQLSALISSIRDERSAINGESK